MLLIKTDTKITNKMLTNVIEKYDLRRLYYD